MADPVVVVCGGRDFKPTERHTRFLEAALLLLRPAAVLHGDCRGADRWAAGVAKRMNARVRAYPADWEKHGPHRAGHIRNAEMAKAAAGGICIAFPGDSGTRSMIEKAEAAGMTVWNLDWTRS